jgi:hypothetical protein
MISKPKLRANDYAKIRIIVINVFIIILLASISSIFANYAYMQLFNPDFKIIILDSNDKDFYVNDTGIIGIQIDSSRFKEYDLPVLLQTWEIPKGLDAKIAPEIGLPRFKSNLILNISKDADPGEKDLIICGISSNGKSKYCRLKLNIKPRSNDALRNLSQN